MRAQAIYPTLECREEIFALRDKVIRASKVATHTRPDLDACLSLWLVQRIRVLANVPPATVLFIPANTVGVEEDVFAVDMGRGNGIRSFGRGFHLKASENGGSAC